MTTTAGRYEEFNEQIIAADYRGAANSFVGLLRDEEPLDKLVLQAVDAAAPFVQTPSHIMRKPDGSTRGINYDHTILGWRGSVKLAKRLGGAASFLPLSQAAWYAPQGLNVWDQVICEFPGHYARDQEKCDTKDGVVDHSFDGPAWSPPKVYFDDHEPIISGTAEDRLDELVNAMMEGRREESYGLFLGLAAEPEHRTALKDAVLFTGIIDLQESLVDHGGYQNIGHKALRARAMVDLADDFGWDKAHSLFYTVVPDLGTSPRLHALWTRVSGIVQGQFREGWQSLKQSNTGELTPEEFEEFVEAVIWAEQGELLTHITGLLREGKARLAIADAIVIAYCRYQTEMVQHPNALFTPGHAFDYCNVVNSWIRNYDNPHQAKALYFEASFVNDVIRQNRVFPPDPTFELEPSSNYTAWAGGYDLKPLLAELNATITAQDAPRTMALVDSYLARTDERQDLLAAISFAACKFQNDPHIQRHCISAHEEYDANRTIHRDQIVRASAKYASRCIKRSLDMGAFELYRDTFVTT